MPSTFQEAEISLEEANPVELYLFQKTDSSEFAFTNAEYPISDGIRSYTPIAISRTQPVQSNERKATNLTVKMNYKEVQSASFAETFIANPVEGTLGLTILRHHLTDTGNQFVQFWEGRVTSTAYNEDGVLQLLCKGVKNIFLREGPNMTWGSGCQHLLYGTNCKLSQATFSRFNVIVDAITNGVQITLDPATLGSPIPDLVGGKMLKSSGLDARLIVAQSANIVTIQQPFRSDFVAGATVNVTEGCDHTPNDCVNQFNNMRNYGGAPFTPGLNPWVEGLDKL